MKLNIITSLSVASAFLMLASCRSNDTENNLNPGGNMSALKVSLRGADFADPNKPQAVASVNGITMSTPKVQKEVTMINPSTFITTELSPSSPRLNANASLSGAVAATNGASLGEGVLFRLIAYKGGTAYADYRDYKIVSGKVELANPADGDLLLLDNVAYNLVAYSYNSNSLDPISAAEKGNLSDANIPYKTDSPDLMFWSSGSQTFGKGNNALNIILRHKTTFIENVKVLVPSPLTLIDITGANIKFTNYSDGSLFFSSGKIGSRATLDNISQDLSYSKDDHEVTATNWSNQWVNTDTQGAKTVVHIAKYNFTDDKGVLNQGQGTTKFQLSPEFKYNLVTRIQKCGLFVGATFKEFMCQNLGATPGIDPFSFEAGNHGAKYLWGKKDPTLTQEEDQASEDNIPGWGTGKYAPANSLTSWTGVNNPCPQGYKVPSGIEINNNLISNPRNIFEYAGTWESSPTNFGSGVIIRDNTAPDKPQILMIPATGMRLERFGNGARGNSGGFWGSEGSEGWNSQFYTNAQYVLLQNGQSSFITFGKGRAGAVRCIAE
ncbi:MULTISPECIES: hypothetical protein [Elizabethkingia]|nr:MULTISPECIES: hypothetical protein [Elizabethkingia]AQW92892.1 hypothetical protein BBD30_01110 [Elizabethkingia anophelis]AQX09818.1 hypothetical protein BBD34_14760 [Elizabethkingia ursingii]